MPGGFTRKCEPSWLALKPEVLLVVALVVTDDVDGAPEIVFVVDAVFEEHAGAPVALVKAALRDACAELFPPIEDATLDAFARIISGGERVEIIWKRARAAGDGPISW